MGRAKERLIELEERGYGEVPDKYVCADCFGNKGIKDFIEQNATSDICSYCGKKAKNGDAIAASLEEVVGLIVRSISLVYKNADSLSWDSEDDCYIGITYDLYAVLDGMGLELTATDAHKYDSLYNDLTSSLHCDLWTDRDTFSKNEAYQAGWRRFVHQVKHNSRYVFSAIKYNRDPYDDPDVPLPSNLLPKILALINDSELRVTLKKCTVFYRARIVSNDSVVSDCAIDLGSPQNENAILSNRMSPAGIPMFYGALDKNTAIQEVRAVKYTNADKKKFESIKVAKFQLCRDITVVDLSQRQEYCLFDENIGIEELNTKVFLNHFVRELSKPIEKDGREHIEYVPTQIVAEYLKYKCVGSDGKRIRGILLPSAQCAKGISCSLFFRNEQCTDDSRKDSKYFLRLIDVETINWSK